MLERWKAAAHRLRVDAHAVWLAARDHDIPLPTRLLGWFIAGYALSPIDLIPDFIPVLGLLDDLIIVPAVIWLFIRLVPPDRWAAHVATAETASHRPISRHGAAVIIVIWLLVAALIAFELFALRYY